MEPTPRQPMTFSFPELINRTFQIYRENFMVIIGLVAFVTIPISLLNIIISPNPPAILTTTTAVSDAPDMSALLLSLLNLLETILITAPLTYLVSEYLFGHKLSIGEAFSGVSSRFTQIGCGVILIGFVVALMAAFILFLVILFPPALIFSGLLIHIIVATSSLMFPVLTLENIGPSAAFNRSWSLGKRRFWAVLGISLVTVLISLLVGSILGSIITSLIDGIATTMNNNLRLLVVQIISDILSIFIVPISPIAFTLIYYDIRMKTEDLGTLLNTGVTSAQRPSNFISPASRFQFDSHDWRNVAILSVIGLIIGVIGNSLVQQFITQFAPGLK
ncbi:MAG: hypothetical protein GC179_23205 [Anaerolineaceae bacterium]|nr:hypothetical protein [Anaerolineaceae bacterium]